MSSFAAETWVLIGLVAAACMLGCLHVLAAYYREHTRLHDLRVRIVQLRRDYADRIARMNAVVDVDEDGNEIVQPVAASPAKKAA